MDQRRMLLVPAAFLLLLAAGAARAADRPSADPVHGYAVLVLATEETNATLNKHLDPQDVNTMEIVLARVYGALVRAGFKDENITVLYASGGVKPDPAEQRCAGQFKRLADKHFNRADYEATRENVLSALRACRQKADANDQLVFWILVNGWPNGALSLAKVTYLIPREMEAELKGLRSRRNYLLFEGCFSGTILERTNMDHAVMVSATGAQTPGWVDRDFSNCATFLESMLDPKCDQDGNGVVDCREAFAATLARAKNYEPIVKKHLEDGHKQPGVPRDVLLRSSVIPTMRIGERFVSAAMGPQGAAEPLSMDAIKTRLRQRQEKLKSLYVRVRRETKVSVDSGVLRGWSRQMSLPEHLGWDEVLFGFKGDKRYWRLLGLDYRPTLPAELAGQDHGETGITMDVARGCNARTFFERKESSRPGSFSYHSAPLAETRDALPPPEYLANVGLAVPDPTGKDEAKRNLHQMGFLPELLDRWPYAVAQKTEQIDGARCVLLEGRLECQLPTGDGSAKKSIADKLWLDPQLGLAIRRRDTLAGGQLFRVLNSDFVEVLPGFWLPKRSQTHTFAPPDAAKQHRDRPVITSGMKLCFWLVNQMPDEMFDLVLAKPGN